MAKETQMTQLNFEISRDLLRAFKIRAVSEGKSMSEILRESIIKYTGVKVQSQGNSAN